jgi:SAM-dependent methyltransferase
VVAANDVANSAAASNQEREHLLEVAAQRLNPSLRDPNYLVLRARRLIFEKWIQGLGSNLSILDIGGRYQPYRPLFEGRIARYVAVDVDATNLVDVVGNGEALPFVPNSFDVVLSTQVFDYIPRPHAAAGQALSVLRPGGVLLMSVPAFAPRFRDDELWRYLPGGIRTILADFSEVNIVPEISSAGGMVRTLNVGLSSLSGNALRPIFNWTVCPLLNLLGQLAESARLTRNDQFTPNYSVLARK